MPGPWSGTVTNTQEVFHRLLSQYIWDKTHRLVEELMSMDLEDSDGINSSSIESIRGFLVYVASVKIGSCQVKQSIQIVQTVNTN